MTKDAGYIWVVFRGRSDADELVLKVGGYPPEAYQFDGCWSVVREFKTEKAMLKYFNGLIKFAHKKKKYKKILLEVLPRYCDSDDRFKLIGGTLFKGKIEPLTAKEMK